MDKKFIEIARAELREDDLRKQQSLDQFRNYLSKHPFLQEVRQGSSTTQQFHFTLNTNVNTKCTYCR